MLVDFVVFKYFWWIVFSCWIFLAHCFEGRSFSVNVSWWASKRDWIREGAVGILRDLHMFIKQHFSDSTQTNMFISYFLDHSRNVGHPSFFVCQMPKKTDENIAPKPAARSSIWFPVGACIFRSNLDVAFWSCVKIQHAQFKTQAWAFHKPGIYSTEIYEIVYIFVVDQVMADMKIREFRLWWFWAI